MKTLQISKFKAQCLGLLKQVSSTGDPIAITLRGKTLAIVQAPCSHHSASAETVAETLRSLHPLLLAENTDLEPPPRQAIRHSAEALFPSDD